MAPSSFGKQTAGCESEHNWLMSLAIVLLCVTCGGENGTNGSHFPVLNEDVAFVHHFVATRPPPPSHPVVVLLVLATPVKNLSKMVGIQLRSYPGINDKIRS